MVRVPAEPLRADNTYMPTLINKPCTIFRELGTCAWGARDPACRKRERASEGSEFPGNQAMASRLDVARPAPGLVETHNSFAEAWKQWFLAPACPWNAKLGGYLRGGWAAVKSFSEQHLLACGFSEIGYVRPDTSNMPVNSLSLLSKANEAVLKTRHHDVEHLEDQRLCLWSCLAREKPTVGSEGSRTLCFPEKQSGSESQAFCTRTSSSCHAHANPARCHAAGVVACSPTGIYLTACGHAKLGL